MSNSPTMKSYRLERAGCSFTFTISRESPERVCIIYRSSVVSNSPNEFPIVSQDKGVFCILWKWKPLEYAIETGRDIWNHLVKIGYVQVSIESELKNEPIP